MIRAKDLRLALIDVAVPRFLPMPPPFGTQDAQQPASLTAKLLYSQRQPIPFDDKQEVLTPKPTQKDLDKDFEVFYQEDPEDSPIPLHRQLVAAQVSTSQDATNVPEAWFLRKRLLIYRHYLLPMLGVILPWCL